VGLPCRENSRILYHWNKQAPDFNACLVGANRIRPAPAELQILRIKVGTSSRILFSMKKIKVIWKSNKSQFR